MRRKDLRKVLSYLKRIAKNPFARQSRAAFVRYIREGFNLIYEKIRGLDFTMVYQCEANKNNNNYSKSPDKVLRKIFSEIDFSEPHNFIDLGCGKGYVMVVAADYPFSKVGGVEYTKDLCDICSRNLNILKLQDRISVFNCDAKEFNGYADYDIFYFCNPFDETILDQVARKIWETHLSKPCKLYYLNPHQEERQKAILNAGFKLAKVIPDDYEKYFDVNVYENIAEKMILRR